MQDNYFNLLEKFKLPLFFCLLGAVLIIGGVVASNMHKQIPKNFPKESLVESNQTISIDVSGAVKTPGVYQLANGSRIEQAIAAAGGFSETANQEYVSKYLNMAQLVADGTKIYIPDQGDPSSPGGYSGQGQVAGASVGAKVNINSSTQSEIEALPGVGPATASKIISGRPYQQIEELLSRKIVGKAVFEKIKDSVVVY